MRAEEMVWLPITTIETMIEDLILLAKQAHRRAEESLEERLFGAPDSPVSYQAHMAEAAAYAGAAEHLFLNFRARTVAEKMMEDTPEEQL